MQIDSMWTMLRDRIAPLLRSRSASAPQHASYALLFALAVIAGRMTTAPDTGVAMVWPAAGVAFVWFLTSAETDGTLWGRRAALVILGIVGLTAPLNMLSGMEPLRAFVFGVGNAGAGFFGACAYRALRAREGVALERLPDVGVLLAASLAAGIGSAIWGPLYAVVWEGGPVALLWQAVTRNSIGTLVFGAILLRILSGPPRVPVPRVSRVVVLMVGAGTLYWIALVPLAHLPLTFLLTSATVAAGLMLTVDGMLVFLLVAGSVILGASFVGSGPFSVVGSVPELFIAQAYVGVQAVIGLVLTLAREDLGRLIQALRDSRSEAERQSELVGRVVGAMSEAVVAVDHGTVVLGNEAARRLFDVSAGGSVLGTGLCSGDADGDLPLDRALAGHAVAQDMTVDVDGERRVVSVWAHPVGSKTGHAVGVIRDVTEDRRHVADLSSFASVLAHDLLNPIGAVEGWLEVIEEECDPATPTPVGRAAARAGQSARRLREIVTGLHAYSVARGGELALDAVDLQALGDRLVGGRIAAAENVEGAVIPVFRVAAEQFVMGDESLVAQVLDNLLGNAVKYTPPGAVPHIAVTAEAPAAGFVTIRVDDDGIGIPEADRDKVFEEFHRVGAHRTSYAGTGLGLSICRRMIERHGGTIRALDSPQGGTRMEFTLPAACPRRVLELTTEAENRAAMVQGQAASEATQEARRRLDSSSVAL